MKKSKIDLHRAIGTLTAVLWGMEYHFKGNKINEKGIMKLLEEVIEILEKGVKE